MKRYENKKILRHARGQQCTMQHPHHCIGGTGTTVAAHANWSWAGKGTGQKAHDFCVAYVCKGCHAWFDGPGDDDKLFFYAKANAATLAIIFRDGVVK